VAVLLHFGQDFAASDLCPLANNGGVTEELAIMDLLGVGLHRDGFIAMALASSTRRLDEEKASSDRSTFMPPHAAPCILLLPSQVVSAPDFPWTAKGGREGRRVS
jgi:hypothetical protein